MSRYLGLLAVIVSNTALASSVTIGPDGINSKATGLDGTGVQIGQGEEKRSGKAMYDDAAHSAPNTFPTGVYFSTTTVMDDPNDFGTTSLHATEVAQVMIGKTNAGNLYEGVAPNAKLHSIGITDLCDDSVSAFALNRLALLNGGNINAINLSWGREIQEPVEHMDGRSQISQFIDWSASRHDVVYVVAWDTIPFLL